MEEKHTPASICAQEPEIFIVEDKPDEIQQRAVNEYAARYREVFNQSPLGLHWIKGLGPVWLPRSEHWGLEQ